MKTLFVLLCLGAAVLALPPPILRIPHRCLVKHPHPPGPPLKMLRNMYKHLPEKCRQTFKHFMQRVHDEILGKDNGCTLEDGVKMFKNGITKGPQGMVKFHKTIGFPEEKAVEVFNELNLCPFDLVDPNKAHEFMNALAKKMGTTSDALFTKLSNAYNTEIRDKFGLSQTCTLKLFVANHHKMWNNRHKVKAIAKEMFVEGDSGCPAFMRGGRPPKRDFDEIFDEREPVQQEGFLMVARGHPDHPPANKEEWKEFGESMKNKMKKIESELRELIEEEDAPGSAFMDF